jgi:hypothetical protein
MVEEEVRDQSDRPAIIAALGVLASEGVYLSAKFMERIIDAYLEEAERIILAGHDFEFDDVGDSDDDFDAER